MTDRIGADLFGDLDLFLGDQRTGNGGAQQIDAFIDRVGAEHGEDEIADELLTQVLDEDVAGLDAQGQRLLAGGLDLLALPQISGEGDDFGAIFCLQPFQDDRGVQSAGIGENDFLDVFLGHSGNP
jgi:hypothetical protein